MKTFYNQNDILEIVENLKQETRLIRNKKILLLGHNGFLGKYFVKIFDQIITDKKINFTVDCYDNYISSSILNKQKINNKKKIKFFKADVSKFKFKKKYDIIIFLAGIASPFIYKKFPLETLSVCYSGVLNLITKAKNDRCKFVFFSSSEIYGNPDKKNLPTKESYYGNVNSFGPRSCYDEGKRVGETLCYIYNKYYNCDVKIIRPFNVFGPLMDKNDYRIIPNIIKKINSNKKILIHGDGKQTRTFCYITDAITGFLKVILRKNKDLIYNIGNPKNEISMNSLVKSFDKILNKKNKFSLISYPDHYPADEPRRRCPNINLAIKNLNYYPKVSVEEGIKRVLQFNKIIKDT
jgi:UDP-glucuronate decarboxylase|tara:strand:- start:155 stop:1207 length:1053 start_codon:yes stop_codon:yes gene_type:complete